MRRFGVRARKALSTYTKYSHRSTLALVGVLCAEIPFLYSLGKAWRTALSIQRATAKHILCATGVNGRHRTLRGYKWAEVIICWETLLTSTPKRDVNRAQPTADTTGGLQHPLLAQVLEKSPRH